MITTETKSIYISGLSTMELDSYFEKFGEEGWLDCEEKILIEIKNKNVAQINKLETFFNINTDGFTFIVVELSDRQKG